MDLQTNKPKPDCTIILYLTPNDRQMSNVLDLLKVESQSAVPEIWVVS